MDAPTAVSGAQSWPALTAWGAGLIQLALGAAALTGAQGGAVLLVVGIALLGLGATGFAWGGTALARGRLVVPRAGVGGALAGILVLVAALVAAPQRISVTAVAAASALLLATGISCAIAGRAQRSDAAPLRLLGLLATAVVVAAVVTPALAATEATHLADDGVDPAVVLQHHH